jgi:site-specific DNA-methyltransferase (adenine-specific)
MTPYYADDLVTLYHGDALTVLPRLASASIGLVVLDPPYSFESISVRGRDDGSAGTCGSPTMLLHQTFIETSRILVPGGVAPILCQWRRMPDVSYLATLAGLRLCACVAWIRNRVGTGGLFRSSWDPILVGSKGAPALRDKAAISNVLQVEPLSGQDHPYAKPPALWAPFMSRIPRGQIVVDPFAGLGASAIAAQATGHRWIGIESDERYCELTVRRLGQQAMVTA